MTIMGLLIADVTLNNFFNDHKMESDEVHGTNVTNITVTGDSSTGIGDVTNNQVTTVQTSNNNGESKTSTQTTVTTPKSKTTSNTYSGPINGTSN